MRQVIEIVDCLALGVLGSLLCTLANKTQLLAKPSPIIPDGVCMCVCVCVCVCVGGCVQV